MQPVGLVSPGAQPPRTRAAAAVGPAKAAAPHEWETAKENFKPLAGGRTAASLKDRPAPLGMDVGLDADGRQAQAAFEAELAAYTGPDPLAIWSRYVKWASDAARSGGGGVSASQTAPAALLPLLERATRELQRGVAAGVHPAYPADPRYLRLWLQYADALPGYEPARDVFAFMAARGIGVGAALFWAARAARAELARDWDGAAAAYAEGAAAGAAPADRLAARRAEFEARMARRVARDLAEGGGGSGGGSGGSSRTALASLRAGAARPRPGAAPANGAAPAVAGTRPAARRPAAARQGRGGAGGLAVFVDSEFGGDGAHHARDGPSAHAAGDGWDALPPLADTRKENEPAAARWAGTTLPGLAGGRGSGGARLRAAAAPAAGAPAAPPVEVFVDDECAAPPPDPVAATRAALAADAAAARPGRARLEKAGGGGRGGAAGLARLVADPLAGHRAAEAEGLASAAAAAEDAPDADPPSDAADVTLATRDALAAVGDLFCGALPGGEPWGGGEGGDGAGPHADSGPPPAPDGDATATLGTRDALAALAAAFGGSAGGGSDGGAAEGVAGPSHSQPGGGGPAVGDDDGLIVPYEDTLFRLPGAAGGGPATATLTRPVVAPPPPVEDERADQENVAQGGGGRAAAAAAPRTKARGLRPASPGRAGVVADPDAEAAMAAGADDAGGDDGFVVAAD